MSRELRAPAATAAAGLLGTVLAVTIQPARPMSRSHHEFQADCPVTAQRPDDKSAYRFPSRGYDQYKPHRGAALGPDYRVPR